MIAFLRTPSSLRSLPRGLLFAIALLFTLFVLLFSLVFVRIIVPGQPTNNIRVGYTIATTVAATALSIYAAGEIQKQWLRLISHEISDLKYQLPQKSSIAPRWRAVLGIANVDERIVNFKSTGLAQLSFLATGLITAATVAALTLQDTVCVASVDAPRIHSGADNNCAKALNNVLTSNVPRTSPLWEYRLFWYGADNSQYYSTTSLGCPSWSGAQFINSINTNSPKDFAYSRNGVAVDNTAIGAPEIFYTQFPNIEEPHEPSGHLIEQSRLQSVSQCLPVMERNPITCRPAGNLSSQPGKNVTISAGGCSFNQSFSEDPNGAFGVMGSHLCTNALNIKDGGGDSANASVGQGTIAIGATNIMSLTLAAAMGDKQYLADNADKYNDISSGKINNLSYVLSCSIDVVPTIQWKTLNLTLRSNTLSSTGSPFTQRVTAVDGCKQSGTSIPQSAWSLGDSYAATAVAALIPPLSEGRYWNGMMNAILNQALNTSEASDYYGNATAWSQLIRTDGFGFENSSTNALEDVLGLIMGITMSQMSTRDSQSPGSPLADSKTFYPPVRGDATYACTRVGPGQVYALLFCGPTLIALFMACYLVYITPRHRTAWKTSRLDDLIRIGQASGRELSEAYRVDQTEGGMEGQRSMLVADAAPMGTSLDMMDRKRSVDTERSGSSPYGWNHGLHPPLDPARRSFG